jgi:hypothetical protein
MDGALAGDWSHESIKHSQIRILSVTNEGSQRLGVNKGARLWVGTMTLTTKQIQTHLTLLFTYYTPTFTAHK